MDTDTTPGAMTAPADSELVKRATVIVVNPQGLHLRPASSFAKLARQFNSRITVYGPHTSANGKSQMDLLLLAAEPGTELTLEVAGPDADAAVSPLAEILASPGGDDDDVEQ